MGPIPTGLGISSAFAILQTLIGRGLLAPVSSCGGCLNLLILHTQSLPPILK